jgi:hypothetical protein
MMVILRMTTHQEPCPACDEGLPACPAGGLRPPHRVRRAFFVGGSVPVPDTRTGGRAVVVLVSQPRAGESLMLTELMQ